jgi:hypothetical protein
MKIRKINWLLWTGFLLSLIAFLSYPFFFVKFPITRDFPWANLVLFGVAAVLVLLGVRRGFSESRSRPMRSKVTGIILATLSFAVFGFFVFDICPRQRVPPRWARKRLTLRSPTRTANWSRFRSCSHRPPKQGLPNLAQLAAGRECGKPREGRC